MLEELFEAYAALMAAQAAASPAPAPAEPAAPEPRAASLAA
jgi:hypothetical protein